VETTGELTGQEEDWRTKVLQDCSRVTDIVKIALPKGATWKPFHIGDKLSQSTRTILKRANDCLKAAKKHKPALMAKGLLQSDIDTLESDISQLQATDASQETSKRSDAPTATAACRKATNDVKQMCDQIHAVASAAFKGNSAKLKPYKEAKKLRYLPAPRKAKATTTTTDAKAAAATAGTTEAKK
jgi:hypothetical protein